MPSTVTRSRAKLTASPDLMGRPKSIASFATQSPLSRHEDTSGRQSRQFRSGGDLWKPLLRMTAFRSLPSGQRPQIPSSLRLGSRAFYGRTRHLPSFAMRGRRGDSPSCVRKKPIGCLRRPCPSQNSRRLFSHGSRRARTGSTATTRFSSGLLRLEFRPADAHAERRHVDRPRIPYLQAWQLVFAPATRGRGFDKFANSFEVFVRPCQDIRLRKLRPVA